MTITMSKSFSAKDWMLICAALHLYSTSPFSVVDPERAGELSTELNAMIERKINELKKAAGAK